MLRIYQFWSYMRFKNNHFCECIYNLMTSIAVIEIFKLNRNYYYLTTEIEKNKKICLFFDKVTFLEQGIFRIFRTPYLFSTYLRKP